MKDTTIVHIGTYKIKKVNVDDIEVWSEANVRHRDIYEGIDELAESINQIGLQQPPLVQHHDGKYRLIIGQRRLLAVKQLGLKKIRVMIKKSPYNLASATIASAVENLHRKDMNPRDIATACQFLKEQLGSDKKASIALGVSLKTFKKYLGYHGVPEELKNLVSEKIITVPEATRLYQLAPTSKAMEIAKRISKLPKDTKERYFIAMQENPTADIDQIKKIAKNITVLRLTIHIPESYSDDFIKATASENTSPAELAQRAVIEWLQRHGYSK